MHAVDYLLKPTAAADLRGALDRARLLLDVRRQREAARRMSGLLEEVEVRRPRSHRFVIREGDRTRFLKAEDVEAIEATGNCMHLHIDPDHPACFSFASACLNTSTLHGEA